MAFPDDYVPLPAAPIEVFLDSGSVMLTPETHVGLNNAVAYLARMRHKKVRRSAGDLTLSATSWAEVAAATGGPGTGAFDIVLPATTGDGIEYGVNFLLGTEAQTAQFDVRTIVSGSPVNSFATAGATDTSSYSGGWLGLAGVLAAVSGSAIYTCLSGDISGGNVRLRIYYKLSGGTRNLFASVPVFQVWARNLGPAAP